MASNKKTEYEIALQVGGKVQATFNDSVKSVGSGFDSMVSMAKTAAKMVTATFAVVKVGQFIGDAVETYSEFEQSMANTAAVAKATEMEYDQLEKAAREMGKATTKTASEASDALGYMMLAGWGVEDAISGLEPVLRLSEATQMDLATCSDLTTDSMSALGLKVEDLSGYLDICASANNSANTTAEALMEAFIGCGGAAKTIGADINDTATALGVLANNGTKGSEAGTALNSMLVRMTSNDKAIDAMDALGASAFDASGNFIGLQDVFVNLQKAMSGMSAEKKADYMAKIAGTNYYTEMSYLLDSVSKSADGSASAWDSLSGSLEDSDGALNNMADTVTDTLDGAFSRLDSAAADAKISLGDAFSDDLTDTVNELSEFIPTLTQRFIEFATNAGPKISKAFRVIKNGVGEAWNVICDTGSWMIDNFDTLEVIIVGIGSTIIAYKVIKGITGMVNAFKNLSLVLTNPWLTVLTGVAVAIVGIATAIKTAGRQAVKNNLAAHFGDIALSMEDISEVAEFIVASDNLAKIQESFAAFDELDGIQKSMQDSIDAVNKMNWKISIGMELSADEKDSYILEIDSYIKQALTYVEQQQYALNVNLALFYEEGDLERQNIVNRLNEFYSGKYTELEEIGKDLSEAVTNAFTDGLLDIDELAEIAEMQSQMARIQEALATSEFDAQLKVMELQYSGANLDADSFKALQEELAAQTETAAAGHKESLTLRIASYDVMLDDGAINKAQYDTAVGEFWEDYLTSMSELEAKTLNFQTETIMQAYGEELQPAIDSYMQSIKDTMDGHGGDENKLRWEVSPVLMWETMLSELSSNDLSRDTKGAISDLLELMQPSLEQFEELKQQYISKGMEVPQALMDVWNDAELLKAMAVKNAGDSIFYILGQQMAGDKYYDETIAMLKEKGYYIPDAIAEGIESNTEEAISPAVDKTYAFSELYLIELFSRGFDVVAGVNISLDPIYGKIPSVPFRSSVLKGNINASAGIPDLAEGHAKGGIFDTPHVAWFSEDGPEAAIPLDGSSNAVSLWREAGQLLGVFDDSAATSQGERLYNGITNYQTSNGNAMGGINDERSFVFSPQIQIEGNASREDIDEALTISMEKFQDLMERYITEKRRVSFAN